MQKENKMSDRDDKKPKSTVDKLKLHREQAKVLGDLASEQVDEYKRALNSMAASEHGALVLKILINGLGVFSPDRGTDVAALIRQSERRNVYLELIRPFLEPNLKQELER